ncbi:MAG: hypothetical protein D6811_05060 [Alphaproteobacteria bacterium]|nr:MAG: hypothetical protein D6811_05060 [Alphaproteobacteria bacterium]
MAGEERFEETVAGGTIAARLFAGDGPVARIHVLHGAVGVPRDFYAPFAQWLGSLPGEACLIYGYRGLGDPPERLRRSTITLGDWGVVDQDHMLGWAASNFPRAELRVIGHSLGGFMTMFHADAGRIHTLTAVCSGPAWWRRTPRAHRHKAWLFWYVLGPLANRLRGYSDGRINGIGADLPIAAFEQWKRWCTNPDLHRPDWGGVLPEPDLSAFTGRLRLIAAADDWIIAPDVVRDLARFYPAAREVTFRSFTPAEAGAPALGHFGLFRRRASRAWPAIAGLAVSPPRFDGPGAAG